MYLNRRLHFSIIFHGHFLNYHEYFLISWTLDLDPPPSRSLSHLARSGPPAAAADPPHPRSGPAAAAADRPHPLDSPTQPPPPTPRTPPLLNRRRRPPAPLPYSTAAVDPLHPAHPPPLHWHYCLMIFFKKLLLSYKKILLL